MQAISNSTKDVIENQIRRFREGSIEGVLDDSSPDAIRELFENLLAEFGKNGGSETLHTQVFQGNMPTSFGVEKRQTTTMNSQLTRFLCGKEK